MIIKARFASQCSRCQGPIALGENIEWNRTERGAKHATLQICEAHRAAPQAPPAVLQVPGIFEFLARASEKLKAPKMRFLAPTDEEMRLSIAGPRAANPGALVVVIARNFIGTILPTGVVKGPLTRNEPVLETLKAIEENPIAAIKAYGAKMCRCSLCNLPLTDEGSVEVGYGPVCARNWNLAWERFGVPVLTMIPEVDERAELVRQLAQAQAEEQEDDEALRAGEEV
jgi:hypothetical protein